MTDERYDIELQDKISPTISSKLKQIATDARTADNAVAQLRKDLAGLNIGGLSAAARAVTSAPRAIKAATRDSTADMIANARAAQTAVTMQNKFNELLGVVPRKTAEARRAYRDMYKDLLLAQEQAAKAAATPALSARGVNVSTAPSRQAQYRAQNLFYQIQDIGVSLGSGQRASTVLLQQGSQILGIYGAQGGLRAGLAQLRGDFLKLIPPQALIAIAALTSGLLLFQREIKNTTGVSVGFGAMFSGLWKTISDDFKTFTSGLGPNVGIALDAVYGVIKFYAKLIFTALTAPFVFGYKTIVTLFKNLAPALGELFVAAMNVVIITVEKGINNLIGLVNAANGPLNAIAKKLGGDGKIQIFDPVNIGRIKNDFGSVKALGTDMKDALSSARDTGRAERFGDRWVKNSIEAQRKADAAGGKGAKDAKQELSEYQKLLDELNAPMNELNRVLPLLNQAFLNGDISTDQYNKKLRELNIAVLQLSTDMDSGLKLGVLRVAEEFTNVADVASNLVVNAFKNAEDALVEFVTKGKLDVKGLVDSIAADFARLAIRQAITAPLASMLAGSIGSASGAVTSKGIGQLFLDGINSFAVGTQYVPHDMLAMVHKGERITPASQNTLSASSASNGMSVTNNININWTAGSGGANDNSADQAQRLAAVMQQQLEQSMAKFVSQQQRIGGQLNRGNVVA